MMEDSGDSAVGSSDRHSSQLEAKECWTLVEGLEGRREGKNEEGLGNRGPKRMGGRRSR